MCKVLWCVTCNSLENTVKDIEGVQYHWTEFDRICHGPFASCPPPELLEDWNYYLTDPSPEEFEIMDESASELLLGVLDQDAVQ